MRGSGTTTSVWMETSDWPATYRADIANHTDILVIGAGIAGLTTAYLLQREGRRVTVLDDGPIGSGETGRTTAHLSNAIDDRFTEIERVYGQQGSRQAAESHGAAIDRIEAIVRDENIDCDFKRLDGYLILAEGCPADLIDDELQAAHRAGLGEVVRVEQSPAPGFAGQPALRFPRQGRFHALKYLLGLAQAFERQGGRIATGVHVSTVDAGQPATVHLGDGRKIAADIVVCCTNSPVIDQYAIHTKQAPYRTYAVGLKVSKGAVADALYWDTLDIYHYVRVQEEGDHDVLIVGGEDHKTGQADDGEQRFRRLEAWTRERFPQVRGFEFRWSGQVMEPIDGLALIGRNPLDSDNVYIATGDSGNGMTHGTIAGMLLTDLIIGRANPWTQLYDPSRKTLGAVKEFVKENLNVAAQYADVVTPGEVSDVSEIAPGHGAVVRRGAGKIAAYRDDAGNLHERSAFCTHLGCVVQWNSIERTWDCPCHGSRFQTDGCVVNGPAIRPLGEAG
jgi:glycine/D-amino acid oxidase-like deaminating enzyme/nitrite reductase/ring-hydroxylating ferredoxin subunit